MTWNYRLIQHEDDGGTWLAIHEVFYDDRGIPEGMSMWPMPANGADWDECYSNYNMMREAFSKPMIHADYFEQLARQRENNEALAGSRSDALSPQVQQDTGEPNGEPQRPVPDTGTTNGRKD